MHVIDSHWHCILLARGHGGHGRWALIVPDNALFSCSKRVVSTVKVVWKKVDNFPARVVGV